MVAVGTLMVFFPLPVAIGYSCLILLGFAYFRWAGRVATSEILTEHILLRQDQVALIKTTRSTSSTSLRRVYMAACLPSFSSFRSLSLSY